MAPTTQDVAPAGAPIACSLGSSQYLQRRARLRELAAEALLARAPIAGGQRLSFGTGRDVERRLREIVAAEASCCAFLDMRVRAGSDVLVLDVTGPDEARPLIEELFT